MKSIIRIVVISFLVSSCSSELVYLSTERVADGLYVEKYKSMGGVYGENYYYYYLTDSISLKHKIAKRGEGGGVLVTQVNDTIFVKTFNQRGMKELKDEKRYILSTKITQID